MIKIVIVHISINCNVQFHETKFSKAGLTLSTKDNHAYLQIM